EQPLRRLADDVVVGGVRPREGAEDRAAVLVATEAPGPVEDLQFRGAAEVLDHAEVEPAAPAVPRDELDGADPQAVVGPVAGGVRGEEQPACGGSFSRGAGAVAMTPGDADRRGSGLGTRSAARSGPCRARKAA